MDSGCDTVRRTMLDALSEIDVVRKKIFFIAFSIKQKKSITLKIT